MDDEIDGNRPSSILSRRRLRTHDTRACDYALILHHTHFHIHQNIQIVVFYIFIPMNMKTGRWTRRGSINTMLKPRMPQLNHQIAAKIPLIVPKRVHTLNQVRKM